MTKRNRKRRVDAKAKTAKDRISQKKLAKERDILKGIMENTSTMMAYFDSEFNFVTVNSAYAKGMGHTVEELIGKNHFVVFPNAENQTIFQKVRATGEPITFFDKPFEFADQPERGKTYWDWTLAPVKNQAGRLQGLVLSLMETTSRKKVEEEITERKRAEEVMKAERKRFLDIIEMLPAYLVLLTPDYHVSYANRFFRERFGEDRGKRCFEYLFGRTEPCEICETYKTLKTMESLEWEWKGPDGHNYYIFDSPFTDVDGSTLIMEVGIDITELKNAEEALRRANEQLKEENQERMRTEQTLRLEEARLDALLQLSQISEAPLNEIGNFTLEQAIALTHSKIGFLGFLNEDGTIYTLNSVSRDVVRECNVAGNPMQWPVSDAGIWADAIRERKTLFVNDYSKPHPRKKGLPFGHLSLERFMIVPIFEDKRITTVVGVANKASDYDKSDERQLFLLLSGMWNCMQKNRSREELKKAYDELEKKVEQRTAELVASTVALQNSQKDLNRAQVVAKVGSWRLNIRRDELIWSNETYRIFGIPKGTFMTYETFLSAVHPDDQRYVDQKWHAALRGEPYDIEHRIVVNGEVKWVHENAELEFDKDGVLSGGFGTVQDITVHKQLEEKVFQSERKYRTLFETSLDGIVSVDVDGHITECNETYANMLGYTKEELKNLTYKHITPEKWHQMEETIITEQVLTRGYSDLYEKEHIRKDGTIFPISIMAWLMKDDDGKPVGMWGIITDITERKWMENELKRHTHHLEQLVEERTRKLKDVERMATIGETAAMIGHDIRNPLQSIKGAIYLAKEEMKVVPSKTEPVKTIEEMLNTIHEQTEYVDKIVSDLQNYARPLEPKLEDTNIQQLLNNIFAEVDVPLYIHTSVKVDKNCFNITVDPTMIQRILTNLITNAIQAMPNGGILTIRATREEEEVLLTVQDTGVGIAEEHKPKIFNPLFTTKAKGTGFGLAVVQRLVEAHNGTVTFESQVGIGTTFTIKLPVSKEVT